MATSQYINKNIRSQQLLYEDIIIESLQFYGQDVYYIPREIVNKDLIFLDDVPSRFNDTYKIEMYIENTEGFDGEGDLFTKFGIELRDQATFVVSRRRWTQLVGDNLEENNFRPREGDIIFLPLSNSLFQIFKVDTESPFFQVNDLPTFRLQCELFEYNDEDFDTGVESIDVIERQSAYTFSTVVSFDVGTVGTNYIIGENVEQIIRDSDAAPIRYTMHGEVSRWSDSDMILNLIHLGASDGDYHEISTEHTIFGTESLTSATPSLVEEIQNIQKSAQNTTFNDFKTDFLDWSESNPFGDP